MKLAPIMKTHNKKPILFPCDCSLHFHRNHKEFPKEKKQDKSGQSQKMQRRFCFCSDYDIPKGKHVVMLYSNKKPQGLWHFCGCSWNKLISQTYIDPPSWKQKTTVFPWPSSICSHCVWNIALIGTDVSSKNLDEGGCGCQMQIGTRALSSLHWHVASIPNKCETNWRVIQLTQTAMRRKNTHQMLKKHWKWCLLLFLWTFGHFFELFPFKENTV